VLLLLLLMLLVAVPVMLVLVLMLLVAVPVMLVLVLMLLVPVVLLLLLLMLLVPVVLVLMLLVPVVLVLMLLVAVVLLLLLLMLLVPVVLVLMLLVPVMMVRRARTLLALWPSRGMVRCLIRSCLPDSVVGSLARMVQMDLRLQWIPMMMRGCRRWVMTDRLIAVRCLRRSVSTPEGCGLRRVKVTMPPAVSCHLMRRARMVLKVV